MSTSSDMSFELPAPDLSSPTAPVPTAALPTQALPTPLPVLSTPALPAAPMYIPPVMDYSSAPIMPLPFIQPIEVAPISAPFQAYPSMPPVPMPLAPITSTATPTPTTLVDPNLNGGLNGVRKPTMTREQLKYCGAIMKQLKRHRDAPAFLNPVDPVLLKIPDYPLVVKNPMDLSTVDQKLNNVEYDSVDDFVRDVNLIFSNCYLYNGRESPVSICASNLESAFNTSLRYMPKENSKPAESPAPKEAQKKTPAAPKAKKEPVKKEEKKEPKISSTFNSAPVSAPSSVHTPITSAFVQSREASEERRPKRDIHAPSKEIPTAIAVKKKGSTKWKADAQLRYCDKILKEFTKKSNAEFMFPFMEPVDWVKLNIPDYPKIIKNPMDIYTIRQKLEDDEYENASQFEADIRLVLWNCFKFNPAGTPVHLLGRRMEKLFNDKWAERPPPPTPPVIEDPASDSESESDSAGKKELNSQLS